MTTTATRPRVTSFAPQFLVDDLERSMGYYQKLGFTFGEPWGGFYAIGHRDGLELHLKEAPKGEGERRHRRDNEHLDAAAGVDGIETFFTQCAAEGVTILKPLTPTAWGTKDFYVEDPDGYIVCFGGRPAITATGPDGEGNVMSERGSHAAVEALVSAINASDLQALDAVFTEDVILEWPQSGERINGGSNRREIYRRFPSLPKVTPRRTTGSGDVWVLEASLDYGDGDPYQCVFIFHMREGKIAKEIAYWSKPFPAPEWRAPWVERM